MKFISNKVGNPTKIVFRIVLVLSILSIISGFNYFYKIGTGHSIYLLVESGIPREEALQIATQTGLKCGFLMILGEHLPITILILISIGLISKSTTPLFKKILRISFLPVVLFGILFLSLGSTYWGQGKPFPDTVLPSTLIYLVISTILWSIIGIGILIRGKHVYISDDIELSEFSQKKDDVAVFDKSDIEKL